MKHAFYLLLVLSICIQGRAEYIKISNTEGRVIEVELTDLEDDKVSFRMRNGSKHTVGMEQLASQSQELIKEWHEKASKVLLSQSDRLRISIHTSRDAKDTDGGYTGWKDIDEKIEPKVVIENLEYTKDFSGLNATLALIGESVVDSRELKVLFKESFKFSVKQRDTHVWHGTPFKVEYLIDDNDSFDDSYGHRYRYSFIVIWNDDGSVAWVKSSRSSWANKPNLIKNLQVNSLVNRDLQKIN